MNYRPLGRTGIHVSPFALGTMMFSSFGNGDQAEVDRMVSRALDAGINFIDTADAYAESEEMVGRALRGRRDDVVLASKFARPIDHDPNHRGGSRRWIVTAVENSLRRLQTDHLDVYQMHRPDPDTDIEETLSALSDLVHSGKVRVIGSSDMPASEIVEAQWVAERRGLGWMHPGRADVIDAGALILSRILARVRVPRIGVAETDILDGIAWSLLDA